MNTNIQSEEKKAERKNIQLNRRNHRQALDNMEFLQLYLRERTGVPHPDSLVVMKALETYRMCVERGVEFIKVER